MIAVNTDLHADMVKRADLAVIADRAPLDAAIAATVVPAIREATTEEVITAFAEGNRQVLRNLLTPEVYQGFASALDDRENPAFSAELPWRDADWREEAFALDLPAGDYLVSLNSAKTWSNPDGRDRQLWPESRALGFALAVSDSAIITAVISTPNAD